MHDLMSAKEIAPLFGLHHFREAAFNRFGIPVAQVVPYKTGRTPNGRDRRAGMLRFANRTDVMEALNRYQEDLARRAQKTLEPEPVIEPAPATDSLVVSTHKLEEDIALLHRKIDRLLAELGVPEPGAA